MFIAIEDSALRTPEGLHDDRADAYALAVAGVAWKGAGGMSAAAVAEDPVVEYDRRREW